MKLFKYTVTKVGYVVAEKAEDVKPGMETQDFCEQEVVSVEGPIESLRDVPPEWMHTCPFTAPFDLGMDYPDRTITEWWNEKICKP